MARPAKYGPDRILDAAASLVAGQGPRAATASAVAQELGAPSGSIYHRFGSRDLLLARLWVRAVRRFQDGYLDALAFDDPHRALVAAVGHVPTWCRDNLDDARVLLLHRREELVDIWPIELESELSTLNDRIGKAIHAYARRRFGRASPSSVERCMFALIDVPYAGVRRYLLAGQAPPPSATTLAITAAQAVLDDSPQASGPG